MPWSFLCSSRSAASTPWGCSWDHLATKHVGGQRRWSSSPLPAPSPTIDGCFLPSQRPHAVMPVDIVPIEILLHPLLLTENNKRPSSLNSGISEFIMVMAADTELLEISSTSCPVSRGRQATKSLPSQGNLRVRCDDTEPLKTLTCGHGKSVRQSMRMINHTRTKRNK